MANLELRGLYKQMILELPYFKFLLYYFISLPYLNVFVMIQTVLLSSVSKA